MGRKGFMTADSEMAGAIVNPVKECVAAGEVALGINVRTFRSGEIARIARATGHIFLYIDAQHALYDLPTIGHLTQAALACGVAPFVRVRSVDDPNISVMLDNGVLGIVAPNVETAAEAQRVVDAVKFSPLGKRSFGGASPHYDYVPVSGEEFVRAANAGIMVFCMIESTVGVDNLKEIASVPGLDGLYLGMNDALLSMGKIGKFDDPEIFAALDSIIEVAHEYDLVVGCGGNEDVTYQANLIRRGVQFLTTQSDFSAAFDGLNSKRRALVSALDAAR
jgi:2-keto-3-deoxy-L-rhamnonate aldolase RhmA